MTTAHRPTWKAAVGRAQEGGWTAGGAVSTSKSVLDVASHTKLKTRKGSQVIPSRDEILKESLQKLKEAEASAVVLPKRKLNPKEEEEGKSRLLKQTAEIENEEQIRAKYDDGDDDIRKNGDSSDESDLDDDSDDENDDSSSSEDSDDEDDEAALQAELAKIRAEREEAKRQAEEQKAEEELKESALLGNPLLQQGTAGSTGKLKRKWNDDVVFRNQAKRVDPAVANKKRFINDTVRNDFHKRFLEKFIK